MRRQSAQEQGHPPNWLPFFTVKNANASARHAEQMGGRRLQSGTETRSGRFAVLADPQGAALAVFEGETDP